MKTYKIDPLGKNRPLMLVRGTRLPESFPDSVAEHMAKSLKANCRGVFITINGEISSSTVSPGVVMSTEVNEDNNTLVVMTERWRNESVDWEDSTGKQFRLEHAGRFEGSQYVGNDPYYTGAYKDLRNFVTGAVPYTGQPLVAANAKQWYSYTTPEGVALTFRGCIQAPIKEGTDFIGLKIDSINFTESDPNSKFKLTLDCDSAVSLGLRNGMNDNSKPFNMRTGIGWLQIVTTDDFKSHITGEFNESTGNGDAEINYNEAYDGFTYNVDIRALETNSDVLAGNNASFETRVKSGSALENSIVASPEGYACEKLGCNMVGAGGTFPMAEEVSPTLNADPTVINLTTDNYKQIVVIRFSNVQEGEQLHLDLSDTITAYGDLYFYSMNAAWLNTQPIGSGEKNFVIDIPQGDDVFAFFSVIYDDAVTLTLSRTKQSAPVRTPGFYSANGTLLKAMTKEEVETDYTSDNCPSETTQAVKNATEFVWPEGVTKVGNYVLHVCTGLTSVTIPEGVTSIGEHTFSVCSGLTSVTIPSTVTSIGTGAFLGCSGLTSVTIPEGVTSIGPYAFKICSALTSVTIPSTVTSIGQEAFCNCTSLNPLTVPNTVTTIGTDAFKNVPKVIYGGTATGTPWGALEVVAPTRTPGFYSADGQLIKAMTKEEVETNYTSDNKPSTAPEVRSATEFVWPEGVTKVGNNAFDFCSGLTSVTIPEGVTSIGNFAFGSCAALTSVEIPNTVTSIDDFAFSGCTGLTSVTIPEGVTSIGNSAFGSCAALTSVTIPSTVTSIGSFAFANCTSVNPLTVPNTVTTIGSYAFKNVPKVIYGGTATGTPWGALEVSTGGSTPDPDPGPNPGPDPEPGPEPEPTREAGFYNANGQLIKAMTKEEVETHYTNKNCPSKVNAAIKNATEFVWPEGVTRVGNSVLRDTKLTSVTIPEGVKSIGGSSFSGCSSLTSVTIPAGVTTIRDCAFGDCSSLTSVTIPEGVKSLGDGAFSGCSALNPLTVPNTVTTIGVIAFSGVPKVIYSGSAPGSPWGAKEIAAS